MQTLEMDSVLSRERKQSLKSPPFFVNTSRFKPADINETLPRTLAQPMAMNSPLGPDFFQLCPPTPRKKISTDASIGTIREPSFATNFSMPSEYSTSTPTTSGWGDGNMLPTLPGLSESEVTSQYATVGGDDWRNRGEYSAALRNLNDDRLGSSYGSNTGNYLGNSYSYTSQPEQPLSLNTDIQSHSRRASDANSMSSGAENNSGLSTAVTEVPPYDYEHAYDPAIMTSSEYTHKSGLSIGSSMSPVISSGHVRSGSRNRNSPSPSRQHRVAPYDKTGSQRWSTGTMSRAQTVTPTAYCSSIDQQLQGYPSHHSSPTCPPSRMHPPQQYIPSQTHSFSMLPNQQYMGHGLPQQQGFCGSYLSSNAHAHAHYGPDFSEPPDLYGCLSEEQIPPPPEDMNPENKDLVPHEQELRFEGDLYTPRWVRGHGNKREGWCGICKPGRWLILKNSAFWYDKSFSHGVSAATGVQFHEPRDMRRMEGNPDVWEGLCHSCNEWVPLVSNKKKGTTWFRHAYKCHSHPKIRDAPKRQRESNGRAAVAKAKQEEQERQRQQEEQERQRQQQQHHHQQGQHHQNFLLDQ